MKVAIKNETGRAQDTKILDEAGREMQGIEEVTIGPIKIGEPITASLRVMSLAIGMWTVNAEVSMIHPTDGDLRKIRRIEFENGSVWEITNGIA